jgi:hypothetical protein
MPRDNAEGCRQDSSGFGIQRMFRGSEKVETADEGVSFLSGGAADVVRIVSVWFRRWIGPVLWSGHSGESSMERRVWVTLTQTCTGCYKILFN